MCQIETLEEHHTKNHNVGYSTSNDTKIISKDPIKSINLATVLQEYH